MAGIKITNAVLINDKGTWVVRARFADSIFSKERLHSKTTGLSADEHNKREAKRKMFAIVEEWERKINGGGIANTSMTFRECADMWLAAKDVELRRDNKAGYRTMLNAHILPILGDIKVRDITRQHIQQYFELKYTEGKIGANTMKKHRVIIRGVLKEALDYGLVPQNACTDIRLPKVTRFIGRALDDNGIHILLDKVKELPEPVKAVVILAVTYGLRRSEICGLRWEDVDFEKGFLCVRNTSMTTVVRFLKSRTRSLQQAAEIYR